MNFDSFTNEELLEIAEDYECAQSLYDRTACKLSDSARRLWRLILNELERREDLPPQVETMHEQFDYNN